MRAVTCRRYGPPKVLRIEDVERPTPADHEVRVRVHATTVTSGDAKIRGFRGAGVFWLPMRLMLGLFRPRNPVPGMEFAGRIDAVGRDVTHFRPGDPVFGIALRGAHAEYLTIAESDAILRRPAGLTDAEAAALPFGALSALVFLRDMARVRPGERVLVQGASGGVGVFAVQLARHFGAHVTGVCSTANMELVRSLGADAVVDYTTTDFTAGAARYDLILDTVGVTSFSRSRRVLTPQGRHVFLVFGVRPMGQMLWTWLRGGQRVICGMSRETKADLAIIAGLVAAGVLRPVIERSYDLQDVGEAHRHVDGGHKRGSVVMLMPTDGIGG